MIGRGPPNPRPKPQPRPKEIKMFPVMMDEREWRELNNLDASFQLPKELPMKFMAQFRVRVMKTHGQTLKRLVERGGLCPTEICAVMYDKNFFEYWGHKKITDEQKIFAINMITMKLNEWNKQEEAKQPNHEHTVINGKAAVKLSKNESLLRKEE